MPTARSVRILLAILVAASGPAACSLLPEPPPAAYPGACDAFAFSARRCSAIVQAARESAAGRLTSPPVSIGLLGPEPGSADLGGYQVARVVFGLAGGTSVIEPVMCIGIPSGPDDALCQEPQIAVMTRADHDVPCSGEPPDGCPSPIVPDAAAVAGARPLRLATLDVPIEGIGHHEVRVGAVGFPNGYVTRAEASIVNDRPSDFWLADWAILELRPDDPSRPPFGNVYLRPLVEGVETATAWLVFDVTEASPGAVLHLKDIVIE